MDGSIHTLVNAAVSSYSGEDPNSNARTDSDKNNNDGSLSESAQVPTLPASQKVQNTNIEPQQKKLKIKKSPKIPAPNLKIKSTTLKDKEKERLARSAKNNQANNTIGENSNGFSASPINPYNLNKENKIDGPGESALPVAKEVEGNKNVIPSVTSINEKGSSGNGSMNSPSMLKDQLSALPEETSDKVSSSSYPFKIPNNNGRGKATESSNQNDPRTASVGPTDKEIEKSTQQALEDAIRRQRLSSSTIETASTVTNPDSVDHTTEDKKSSQTTEIRTSPIEQRPNDLSPLVQRPPLQNERTLSKSTTSSGDAQTQDESFRSSDASINTIDAAASDVEKNKKTDADIEAEVQRQAEIQADPRDDLMKVDSEVVTNANKTEPETVIKPSAEAMERLQEAAKLREEEERERLEQEQLNKKTQPDDNSLTRSSIVRQIEEDENYDE